MTPRGGHWALALVASVCFPLTVSAQGTDGLAVLERAAERYGAVQTLCANFIQRLEVPLLGEERTGTGRMCQARPDRFAMRFAEPAGDLVVVDGEFVWLYYPSLDAGQVIRLRVSGPSGGYDLHREFLERPAEKYEVTLRGRQPVDGVDAHHLRLVPRTPASYVAAELWIEVGTPVLRRIRIEEENGTVRTVSLSDVRLEPEDLEDDWFSFSPPPGAQVISR